MAPKQKRRRTVAQTSAATPVVASLRDLLAFQPFCFKRVAEALGDDPDDDSTYIGYGKRIASTTMSTAFSGIGAPECAA